MRWEDVFGFSKGEMEHYQEVVESTAHLMLYPASPEATFRYAQEALMPFRSAEAKGEQ